MLKDSKHKVALSACWALGPPGKRSELEQRFPERAAQLGVKLKTEATKEENKVL